MAILGVQRLLATQLIFYLPTVTTASVASMEIGIVIMHLIRSSELPLVKIPFQVTWISIVSVGSSHDAG